MAQAQTQLNAWVDEAEEIHQRVLQKAEDLEVRLQRTEDLRHNAEANAKKAQKEVEVLRKEVPRQENISNEFDTLYRGLAGLGGPQDEIDALRNEFMGREEYERKLQDKLEASNALVEKLQRTLLGLVESLHQQANLWEDERFLEELANESLSAMASPGEADSGEQASAPMATVANVKGTTPSE